VSERGLCIDPCKREGAGMLACMLLYVHAGPRISKALIDQSKPLSGDDAEGVCLHLLSHLQWMGDA